MVAASVLKSALTQWGNFKLAAALHRWQKITSIEKSQHTARQYRVAATVRLCLLPPHLERGPNRTRTRTCVACADAATGREALATGLGSVAPDVHGAPGGRGCAQVSELSTG